MARFAFTERLLAGVASLVLLCTALTVGAAAQSPASIPDFSSNGTSWQTNNGGEFIAVPGSPVPVRQDPAHPFVPNGQGKQPTYRIADLTNSNLKQWAKDIMKKDNDEVLAGKIAFTPASSCKPAGVPAFMLAGGPYYFVQSPKEVVIITQGDHQVRRIHLDVPHSANPKPSWYGESVGHYEGDTLVIDTTGLNTKTFIDNYRTPHGDKLHVVERYRMIEDGRTLEANVTIEDPAALKQPLRVTHRWRKVTGPIIESRCADGESFNPFDTQRVEKMPVADKSDF